MPRTQSVDPASLRTLATQLLEAGTNDGSRLHLLQPRRVQHRLGVSPTTETCIPSLGQGFDCVGDLELETIPRVDSQKAAEGQKPEQHTVFDIQTS